MSVLSPYPLRSADLNPPLGAPHPSGSPCRVVRRVLEEVQNPRLQRELAEDVEDGDKLTNPEARRIYKPIYVKGPDRDPGSRVLLTSHAQYRMDLRQVGVDDVRKSLNNFVREIQRAQSQKSVSWLRNYEQWIHRGYEYDDKKTGLFLAFRKDRRDWVLITSYWKRIPDPRPTNCPETVWLQDDGGAMRRAHIAKQAAARHIEAARLKDWIKWVVQPLDIIWKYRRKFIGGPIDDLMDDILRVLAPKLVEVVGEIEVEDDVEEFTEGAINGKYDADRGYFKDVPTSESEDYAEGYSWGFDHADWKGHSLPSSVRREVVQEAVQDFRHRVTEEVVIRLLKKSWSAISPINTFKAIIAAVKTHGWKIGVGIAIIETLETFVLPATLVHITGDPRYAIAGTLPLSEIVYAVTFKVLSHLSREIDKPDDDGHLDWYRDQVGQPIRLASASFPSFDEFTRLYQASRA